MLRRSAMRRTASPKSGATETTSMRSERRVTRLSTVSVTSNRSIGLSSSRLMSSSLSRARENGLPLDPDGTSSRWNRLVRTSGLPRIRFHDARHTHATLLLKAGVPPHVVSQRLGHASVAFTMHQYAHVLPQQQQEAVDRLAALIDTRPDASRGVRLASDEETPRPSDVEIGP